MLYAPEDRDNARRNVQRYTWAREECEAVVARCRPWLQRSDAEIWSLVSGQGVPRGIHVNPDLGCPRCGRQVYECAGNYPWIVTLARLWKLECPSCGAVWPENDFAALHTSGLAAGGVFDPARADRTLLCAEPGQAPQHESGAVAVDDGLGWVDPAGNRWWFVAYYAHYCIWKELPAAAADLARAHLLTGDADHAHKALLILARIADVYPAMDLAPYSEMGLYNSHGGTGQGRIQGCIWETGLASGLADSWAMVEHALDGDAELVEFLTAQEPRWGAARPGDAPRNTVASIRSHVQNNLLREFISSCRDGRIRGNERRIGHQIVVDHGHFRDGRTQKLPHFFSQPRYVDELNVEGALPRVGQHLPRQLGGSIGSDLDLLHIAARRRLLRQPRQSQAGVAQHTDKQIIEVMRNPPRKHSQTLQLLRVPDLLLQMPLPFLGPLAFRYVANDPTKARACTLRVPHQRDRNLEHDRAAVPPHDRPVRQLHGLAGPIDPVEGPVDTVKSSSVRVVVAIDKAEHLLFRVPENAA